MDVEQRARFEEWITKAYPDRDLETHEDGRYAYAFASLAWEAWMAALTPPEGFVLVPVEPTEAMLDAGRAAVMAEHCAGPKWTPRQHFYASGRTTDGIPEDVLDERGPLTKESTAVMVFGAMLAARPEVKP